MEVLNFTLISEVFDMVFEILQLMVSCFDMRIFQASWKQLY